MFSESGTTLTTIAIEDANPAATVASFITDVQGISTTFGSGFADGSLSLFLDGPTSSTLLASESIGFSLSVTATNNIVLQTGSTITMAGSNNKLTLTSEDGDINLFGQLSVAGTTSLNTESQSDAANNIFANNAGNAFGTLELNSDSYDGGTITIVSANTLTFGNSTIASASLTATADAGSILQVKRRSARAPTPTPISSPPSWTTSRPSP